jgi:hypothetical protein
MPRRSEEAASFDVGLILPQCIDKIVSFIPVLSSIPAEDIARWPEAKKRDDGVLVLGGLEPYYHPPRYCAKEVLLREPLRPAL